MILTRTGIGLALFSTAVFSEAAFGQAGITAAASPAFDIAEIHSGAHVTNPFMRGGVLRNSRYDVRTASMLELISNAYEIGRASCRERV